MAPLASNLSERCCHALAEADGQPITDWASGECSEPDSATVSWLTGAAYRDPATVGAGRMVRRTANFQATRGLPPSLSPGVGLSLSQHVLVAPVLEMMERHKKLVSAGVSGPL